MRRKRPARLRHHPSPVISSRALTWLADRGRSTLSVGACPGAWNLSGCFERLLSLQARYTKTGVWLGQSFATHRMRRNDLEATAALERRRSIWPPRSRRRRSSGCMTRTVRNLKSGKILFREDPEAPTRIDYLFSRRRIMLGRLQHWASAPVVSFIGCLVRNISRTDQHTR